MQPFNAQNVGGMCSCCGDCCGVLRSLKKQPNPAAAVPWVVGIFEFQVNAMDEAFARDHEEYFETAFGRSIQAFKTPVLRTVPIDRQIVADWPVAPYEDVLEIIDNQKKIAVTPCICRTQSKLAGRDCDKPLENCFSFGSHADYYVENGMGRYITKKDAKAIIIKNEQDGLVMQPFNAQNVGGMCSCCGDCCGVLRSLKKQPNPAAAVQAIILPGWTMICAPDAKPAWNAVRWKRLISPMGWQALIWIVASAAGYV
jgi:hypothetical protein